MEFRSGATTREGGVLVFRTPRLERAWSVFFAIIAGGGFLVFSFVGAGIVLAAGWALGAPWFLAVAVAVVGWLLMMCLTWRVASAPLRFSVRLGNHGAELGGGWLKCEFLYDDVEMISLPEELDRQHGVAIEAAAIARYGIGKWRQACVVKKKFRGWEMRHAQ